MRKLYEKSEIWFAVAWIIAYSVLRIFDCGLWRICSISYKG
mgnify:FL=1